jgi:adenosylcobinamide-GDP ribazoletransferase
MRLYFIALQFLTIIPLPFSIRCEEEDLGRSMAFFPLVGMTIGGMLLALDAVLSIRLPRPVVDLLLIIAMTAITGALHLDGLADVCDGIAARGGRDRFLAVMKDSRTGAVGVVGVALGLLLKYQLLLAVPDEFKWAALLFVPMAGRFSQVQMTIGAQRARTDGLGSLFIGGVGMLQFVIADLIMLVAAWLLLGRLQGLLIFMAGYLLTWLVKRWFHHRLGGVTGDVIGCVSELNELLALLVIVGVLGVKG